jgi:hypothetical protein
MNPFLSSVPSSEVDVKAGSPVLGNFELCDADFAKYEKKVAERIGDVVPIFRFLDRGRQVALDYTEIVTLEGIMKSESRSLRPKLSKLTLQIEFQNE